MKITLIVVLYSLYYGASTTNTTSTFVCTSSPCSPPTVYATTNQATKTIKIPMPDLKACLEARHQFDDYQNLTVAACSAE